MNDLDRVRLSMQMAEAAKVADFNAEREKRRAEFEREVHKHISDEPVMPFSETYTKLVDSRRKQYMLINEFFEYQAVYDRVYVQQVSRYEGDKIGDGLIVMADSTKQREREISCLGIIVSAGLKALDELRSNGMDVGHMVNFVRNAPFRVPVATIAGKDFYLVCIEAGSIMGSCDLASGMRDRTVRTKKIKLDDGSYQHVHCDADGNLWQPQDPFRHET